MKNLKQYIEEKLFHQHVDEKLIVNKDYNIHKYHPTTWDELRRIIEERYEKLGPGTKNKPIDFNDIDVSGMNSFYSNKEQAGIFERTNFEYIDVSYWDVSNVTDMHAAFWGCTHLKSVGNLSNWNVSNVEDMWHMFGNSPITNTPDWYEE